MWPLSPTPPGPLSVRRGSHLLVCNISSDLFIGTDRPTVLFQLFQPRFLHLHPSSLSTPSRHGNQHYLVQCLRTPFNAKTTMHTMGSCMGDLERVEKLLRGSLGPLGPTTGSHMGLHTTTSPKGVPGVTTGKMPSLYSRHPLLSIYAVLPLVILLCLQPNSWHVHPCASPIKLFSDVTNPVVQPARARLMITARPDMSGCLGTA